MATFASGCLGPGPDLSHLKTFQIPGTSMEPTLLAGDYIVASPLTHGPSRGQLVIFDTPHGPYVQRFVGMAGDTLSMRNGILSVNGCEVQEPYANRSVEGPVSDSAFDWQRAYLPTGTDPAHYRPTLTSWGPIVIPTDSYFALGDNRGASADSRYRGLVADTAVIAEPVLVYFSRDRETGRIRWRRIGKDPRRQS
jgi:signal peptidase I